jgi:hypothetical protein
MAITVPSSAVMDPLWESFVPDGTAAARDAVQGMQRRMPAVFQDAVPNAPTARCSDPDWSTMPMLTWQQQQQGHDLPDPNTTTVFERLAAQPPEFRSVEDGSLRPPSYVRYDQGPSITERAAARQRVDELPDMPEFEQGRYEDARQIAALTLLKPIQDDLSAAYVPVDQTTGALMPPMTF